MADEPNATLVPVKDDGLLSLTDFVEKARVTIDDMQESLADCTGVGAGDRRSLDCWLDELGDLMHNS